MQEGTNSVLYQRRRNVWSKKAIYTLKLVPKHVTQITKFHTFQVLSSCWTRRNICHWVVPLCWCVCGVPRCAAGSLHGLIGRFTCLCMMHIQQTFWDATDTLSWPRNVTRTSTWQQWGVTVALWLWTGVLPVSNKEWRFLVCFLSVSRKELQ